MIIHDKPLEFYVNKLKKKEYFSIGAYGDGEWIAILHERVGLQNTEGTIYTSELCRELKESLNFQSDNFLFSTPVGLRDGKETGIGEKKIDRASPPGIEFYEKDMWDREARLGGLVPFIKQLQKMNVVVISNKALRKLPFYDHFIEVSYPNCYEEKERITKEIIEYGKSGVYLFSCGLPASIFVQSVHGKIRRSWFLDVGSIWDAFVGIGEQRGWRKELYKDKLKYGEWKSLYKDAGF